jgi:hypothetical protein
MRHGALIEWHYRVGGSSETTASAIVLKQKPSEWSKPIEQKQ